MTFEIIDADDEEARQEFLIQRSKGGSHLKHYIRSPKPEIIKHIKCEDCGLLKASHLLKNGVCVDCS